MWLYKHEMYVPCGKCELCKKQRSLEWSVRLLHEADYWPSVLFLTLTYDEESLPVDGALDKRALQLYFKRVRKFLRTPLKFLATGEYGGRTGRAHYHAIVFCHEKQTEVGSPPEAFRRAWSFGMVHCGSFAPASARYVTKYTMKSCFSPEVTKAIYGAKQPPFMLVSQGLGRRWAMDNQDTLITTNRMTINGNPMSIPRYYVDVLGIDKDDLKAAGEERRRELADRLAHLDPEGIFDEVKRRERQAGLNQLARENLSGKERI